MSATPELQLLAAGGQIAGLRVHPAYELQAAFRDREGRRVAAIRYVADFAYIETVTTVTVVEDVKGARTAVYLLKAKIFPIRLRSTIGCWRWAGAPH